MISRTLMDGLILIKKCRLRKETETYINCVFVCCHLLRNVDSVRRRKLCINTETCETEKLRNVDSVRRRKRSHAFFVMS